MVVPLPHQKNRVVVVPEVELQALDHALEVLDGDVVAGQKQVAGEVHVQRLEHEREERRVRQEKQAVQNAGHQKVRPFVEENPDDEPDDQRERRDHRRQQPQHQHFAGPEQSLEVAAADVVEVLVRV